MNKENLYVWACDYSEISGEGNLARLFTKRLSNHYNVIIKTPSKNHSQISKIMSYKYVSPFIGVLFCWYFFLQKKKTCYINYLPLWNALIFILLPPSTKIGPITGGANFTEKSNDYIIRRYLFPILYKFSNFILSMRYNKICFSTDLLKCYLSNSLIKKSKFNYVLEKLKKKTYLKKNIDFIIYHREHKNKKTFFPYDFLKKISSRNYNIHIVGDRLNLPNVKNHGYIGRIKLERLMSKSKYTICSGENIYSFFILECIEHNIKILVEKKYKTKIIFYKKNFFNTSFDRYEFFQKKILMEYSILKKL